MLVKWMRKTKWVNQMGIVLAFPFLLLVMLVIYLVLDDTIFLGVSWGAEWQSFKEGKW